MLLPNANRDSGSRLYFYMDMPSCARDSDLPSYILLSCARDSDLPSYVYTGTPNFARFSGVRSYFYMGMPSRSKLRLACPTLHAFPVRLRASAL